QQRVQRVQRVGRRFGRVHGAPPVKKTAPAWPVTHRGGIIPDIPCKRRAARKLMDTPRHAGILCGVAVPPALPPSDEAVMNPRLSLSALGLCAALAPWPAAARPQPDKERLYLEPVDVKVPPIASDKTVKYDYDIVYVRAKRAGDKVHKRFY